MNTYETLHSHESTSSNGHGNRHLFAPSTGKEEKPPATTTTTEELRISMANLSSVHGTTNVLGRRCKFFLPPADVLRQTIQTVLPKDVAGMVAQYVGQTRAPNPRTALHHLSLSSRGYARQKLMGILLLLCVQVTFVTYGFIQMRRFSAAGCLSRDPRVDVDEAVCDEMTSTNLFFHYGAVVMSALLMVPVLGLLMLGLEYRASSRAFDFNSLVAFWTIEPELMRRWVGIDQRHGDTPYGCKCKRVDVLRCMRHTPPSVVLSKHGLLISGRRVAIPQGYFRSITFTPYAADPTNGYITIDFFRTRRSAQNYVVVIPVPSTLESDKAKEMVRQWLRWEQFGGAASVEVKRMRQQLYGPMPASSALFRDPRTVGLRRFLPCGSC